MKLTSEQRVFCLSGAGILLALFLFAAFGSCTESAAESDQARVVRVLGKARARADDGARWRPLTIGAAVRQGETLETAESSQLIVQYEGLQIRLGPQTVTRLSHLLSARGTPASRDSAAMELHLERGFGWFRWTNKDPRRQMRVTTPTSIASVRGTKFSIVESDAGTLSCVCEGAIQTTPRAGGPAGGGKLAEKGASLTYDSDGTVRAKDLTPYFRGLKADRSFQSQILKDNRLNYCKSCHRMTNLATDTSPDTGPY